MTAQFVTRLAVNTNPASGDALLALAPMEAFYTGQLGSLLN
jgi:hypothetical protein